MEVKKTYHLLLYLFIAYLVLITLYYAVSTPQVNFHFTESALYSGVDDVGELLQGRVVTQSFSTQENELAVLNLRVGTYGRMNTVHLQAKLIATNGTVLAENTLPMDSVQDQQQISLFPDSVPLVGYTRVILELSSPDGTPGNAITLYYGNIVRMSRVEVEQKIAEVDCVVVDGETRTGQLSFKTVQRSEQWLGHWYWPIVAVVGVLLGMYLLYVAKLEKEGKPCLILNGIHAFWQYNYLIEQMVQRDFKTKYKRSILGVLWSLLNPLMTMTVQYVVFSTIFKSSIENFPVYLLIGTICYAFFNESISSSLSSIVVNAGLITKVYVPKYIYPFTKVVSSGINLLFSLIPLLLVMILTGTHFTFVMLLIPVPLLFLFMLCTGLGLLLCTGMTFFRDVQFLWSVVVMLWSYYTPIFYPESIIPDKWLGIFKLNPLYHVVRLMRSLLISGVSPDPKTYLVCFITCFIPFVIGVWAFKRKQDRFILYI